MNILVIDGQGGMLGSQLVREINASLPQAQITAIGTNAIATSAMLKAGAKKAATGENPVVVACRTARVIIGPIGIVIADSLLGEITPAMATAIGQSPATKILIPISKCNNLVAGIDNVPVSTLIEDVISKLRTLGKNDVTTGNNGGIC